MKIFPLIKPLFKCSLLLTVICSISLGCQQERKKQGDIASIFIDIPTSRSSVDSLFSHIELIRLDTINGGILNFISDLQYINNRILITQRSTDEVFCFDSSGRFNFKISDRGQGPNEYSYVSVPAYNPYNKTLIIVDGNVKKLHIYDTLGKYIRNIKIDHKGERISDIIPISSDQYLCISGKWSSNYDLFSVTEDSVVSTFSDPLPVFGMGKAFYQFDNQLYHYKWHNDTIYRVENGTSLIPQYTFDFADNNADVSIPRSVTNEDVLEDIIKKKGICLSKMYESDKYLYMNLIHAGWIRASKVHLLYDKTQKQIFNIGKFKENFSLWQIWHLTEDGYMICTVPSHELESVIDVELLDSASQNIYNQITEYDNPVVLKCKLR